MLKDIHSLIIRTGGNPYEKMGVFGDYLSILPNRPNVCAVLSELVGGKVR